MITINGSEGEGSGQVVRNACALSLVTGTPVRITNVRAKRSKPGLMRQHVTAVALGKRMVDLLQTVDREAHGPGNFASRQHDSDGGSAPALLRPRHVHRLIAVAFMERCQGIAP